MRIVIIGAGKTGSFLAEKFQGTHDVTIIEQRGDRAARLQRMVPEANVVVGDACEPDVLERAGIEGADLIAAVTGDDEDNLVVSMLSRLYDVKTVYARVNHPSNSWLFDKEWGVDVPISAPQIIFGLIDKDLGIGDLITLLKLKTEGVFLKEITLPETAEKAGHLLREVSLPPNVTVIAILSSNGQITAPRGDSRLSAGDQMLLLVEGTQEDDFIREAFGIPMAEEPFSEDGQ